MFGGSLYGLSELPEITVEMMLYLPHYVSQDVSNLCLTSTQYYKLFSEDYYWRKLLSQEFGPIWYKPEGLTCQQYGMAHYLTPKEAARYGRMDVIQCMKHLGKHIHRNDLLEAVTYERDVFIKEYFDIHPVVHISETIKLLSPQHDEATEYELIATECANTAASHGYLHIIIFIKELLGIIPDDQGLLWAMHNKHNHVVEWLEKEGVKPEEYSFIEAIKLGNFDLIKHCWSCTRTIVDYKDERSLVSKKAGLSCSIEILEWLLDMRYVLGHKTVDSAASHSTTAVLDWFASKCRLPSPEAYQYAVEHNRIESLNWLENHDIDYPLQLSSNDVNAASTTEVLEWFAVRNILPTAKCALYACTKGNLEVIKWLGQKVFILMT